MDTKEQEQDVAKAKQFVIDRVLRQAAKEGVELSRDEQLMLDFAEPASEELLAAAQRMGAANASELYEAKIVGLLCRARETDEAQGRGDAWDGAVVALDDVDCYLMVMIEQAFRGAPSLFDANNDNVIPGPSMTSLCVWFVVLMGAIVLGNVGARLPHVLMSVLWALWATLLLWSLKGIIQNWRL